MYRTQGEKEFGSFLSYRIRNHESSDGDTNSWPIWKESVNIRNEKKTQITSQSAVIMIKISRRRKLWAACSIKNNVKAANLREEQSFFFLCPFKARNSFTCQRRLQNKTISYGYYNKYRCIRSDLRSKENYKQSQDEFYATDWSSKWACTSSNFKWAQLQRYKELWCGLHIKLTVFESSLLWFKPFSSFGHSYQELWPFTDG